MNEVRHNAERSRFELDLEGGVAVADYRLAGGVMTFTHTEVPAHLRGRGFGGRLVQGALAIAQAEGRKVVPRCWFVRDHIAQHPEFRDLLAE